MAAPRRFSGKTSPMIVIDIPPNSAKSSGQSTGRDQGAEVGSDAAGQGPQQKPGEQHQVRRPPRKSVEEQRRYQPGQPRRECIRGDDHCKAVGRQADRPLSSGASGMITMKSTIEVNCTVARTSKIKSFLGRRSTAGFSREHEKSILE